MILTGTVTLVTVAKTEKGGGKNYNSVTFVSVRDWL